MDLGQGLQGEVLERLGDRKGPRIGRQLLDPLGDVPGQVAEPLEVAIDLENGGNPPQVRGDRLVQGQNPNALALDLDLPSVHRPLPSLDLAGQLDPAVA